MSESNKDTIFSLEPLLSSRSRKLKHRMCDTGHASATAATWIVGDELEKVGRLFTPDDNRVPGGHPLVVLSHGYWQRRSIPLNKSAVVTLQQFHTRRMPDCSYVFPHPSGRKLGNPVWDVKNAFHTALAMAEINDFTWHDLRHTFASWLMMRGASLARSPSSWVIAPSAW